jgi:hypothetical protein
MSITALNWAKQAPAKGIYERSLLIELADRASDTDGECWPHLKRIADMLGCSERQMERAALSLVGKGLVERDRERRLDGTWGGYRYRLPVAIIRSFAAKQPRNIVAQVDLFGTPEPPDCQSNHPTAGQVDHPTDSRVMNPHKKEPNKTLTTSVQKRRKKIAQAIPADWTPTDADRAYARSHNVDPNRAAEEFHNYWLANGKPMKDWSLTFHNRVLALEDAGKFRANGHGNNNTGYGNY